VPPLVAPPAGGEGATVRTECERRYGREGGCKRDERTVDLAELLDADAGLEVDGAGDGGSTSEVPVGVVRRLLLEAARLDDVHVPRHLHLCEKRKAEERRCE